MKWNALIFAAGFGSRMQHLTSEIAKPALRVGDETLLSRLIRQISSASNISDIYVNCSYKPETVVHAISESPHGRNVKIVWESEPIGTSRSLLVVTELAGTDVLAIHGDLFLDDNWLENIVQEMNADSDYSQVVIHRRKRVLARSEVNLEQNLVVSITKPPFLRSEFPEEEVWSNSGIYLIRSKHLQGVDFRNIDKSEIVDGILQHLISRQLLKAVQFSGYRHSVENPHDLSKLRASIENP